MINAGKNSITKKDNHNERMKKPKIEAIWEGLIDIKDNLLITSILEEETPKIQEILYSET